MPHAISYALERKQFPTFDPSLFPYLHTYMYLTLSIVISTLPAIIDVIRSPPVIQISLNGLLLLIMIALHQSLRLNELGLASREEQYPTQILA